MNLIKNKMLIGFVLLLILLIMAIPFLDLPHFWDGILWVNSAEWMSRNNFNLILPGSIDYGGLDAAHPPLLFLTLSLAFYLFDSTIVVSHIILLLFAFLTAYFTYLLGLHLFNRKVGLIASIFLLFSPLFYAQTHIVNLDLPLAAFTVMTIYFVLRGRVFLYLISASLLVLTKEPGVLTVIAIIVYVFIKNFKGSKKELFKKCFIHSLPLFALVFWILFHWSHQNQVILGHSSVWRPITFIMFFRFFNRIRDFFFGDFRWVFTFVILTSLLFNHKKLFDIKKIMIALGIGIFSFILFTLGFKLLLSNIHLLESVILLVQDAFTISEKNLQNLILDLYAYRFIFAIFITLFIFLLIKRGSGSFSKFKDKKLIPVYLTFLFYFLLFSWTFYQPRYSLPLYAFFFIFSVNALSKVFPKKLFYVVTSVVIVLLITQWYGHSNDTRGYLLEKNLEYRDSVITHKDMADYIETNFPKATVLTYNFMIDELRYTHLGYVQNTISPLDYTHYDPDTKKTDFALNTDDWYFYQCYLKNQCDKNIIPVGKGDIRKYDKRYNEYLTVDDFDLFYYSPQSPYPISWINIVSDFNLTLIKRFEKNEKYAELYATEKFLSKTQE